MYPPGPTEPLDSSAPSEAGSAAGRSDADLPLGDLAGTRYRLDRRIGEGAMGVVYAASHKDLGKQLAIKVMHPIFARSAEYVRRFADEARSASAVGHPHIVDVTDFGRTPEGLPFLVMEYLEGSTLDQLLRKHKTLDCVRALDIAQQAADALSAVHQKGVIHRDLKPENIVLIHRDGKKDFVKILDFGVAKRAEPAPGVDPSGPSGPSRRSSGTIVGTPDYMAPEQAMGGRVDGRADVYSLGAILYEMLSGVVPFEGRTSAETLARAMTEKPLALAERVPERLIHPAIDQAVLKALERDPDKRFAEMEAFAEELVRVRIEARVDNVVPQVALEDLGKTSEVDAEIDAAWAGAVERASEPRLPAWAFLAGLTVLLGAAALWIGLYETSAQRSPRSPTVSARTVAPAVPPAQARAAPQPASPVAPALAAPPSAAKAEPLGRSRPNAATEPQTVERLTRTAESLFDRHRYAEAEQAARRAVQARPAAIRPHLVRGLALIRLGRAGEAREEWRTALRLDPRNREARAYLETANRRRR